MSSKRSYDSDGSSSGDEEEELLDVYHYIAVAGGQEYGRHPGEEPAQPAPSTSRADFYAYWKALVEARTAQGRPTRINLAAQTARTPLEAAVEAAEFKSRFQGRPTPIDPRMSVSEEAVQHFRDVARINAGLAEERAQNEAARIVQEARMRRTTPTPAPMTPNGNGRPPMTPQRNAVRPALPLRRAGGIAATVRPPTTPEELEGGIAGLGLNPEEARNRFGRALRNKNLSAHKRAKYMLIYNMLARFA